MHIWKETLSRIWELEWCNHAFRRDVDESDKIRNNSLRKWVKLGYLKPTLLEYFIRQRLNLVKDDDWHICTKNSEQDFTSDHFSVSTFKWMETKCYDGKKMDTLVINSAEGEAGAWEAGKAISIQPGLQGNILKHKRTDCTCMHTHRCSKINIVIYMVQYILMWPAHRPSDQISCLWGH